MHMSEYSVIASVMRILASEGVLVSWRTGDGFRHTRKGEWDKTQAVLEKAAATLQALLDDDSTYVEGVR